MSERVTIPERCPICGSERLGISEGRVYMKCGTILVQAEGDTFAVQSSQCLKASTPSETIH